MTKIPQIKNSEEAIAFGKVATEEQIKLLKVVRNYYLKKLPEITKNTSREVMDKGMIDATQAQFMREALQSAGCKDIK